MMVVWFVLLIQATTDYISMLDWDGDIRDYGAKAVSISDQTSFDSTAAIAAALKMVVIF